MKISDSLLRSGISGKQSAETPYGVPYRPSIWGAGWDIQRFGFEYYFLTAAYPDIFPATTVYDALNFVLGCHPGSNNASFASGVGAKSATVAYGLNRADWSYIPGGVVSGTALIRPDFPELLEFPFLWQQTEYVLGGGSSHYMFLVLAARQLLKLLFCDTQVGDGRSLSQIHDSAATSQRRNDHFIWNQSKILLPLHQI